MNILIIYLYYLFKVIIRLRRYCPEWTLIQHQTLTDGRSIYHSQSIPRTKLTVGCSDRFSDTGMTPRYKKCTSLGFTMNRAITRCDMTWCYAWKQRTYWQLQHGVLNVQRRMPYNTASGTLVPCPTSRPDSYLAYGFWQLGTTISTTLTCVVAYEWSPYAAVSCWGIDLVAVAGMRARSREMQRFIVKLDSTAASCAEHTSHRTAQWNLQ